jgi:electron transfer flavoprotein alpha subunit
MAGGGVIIMADAILFLAHTEADGSLSRITREALSGALSIAGSSLIVGSIGVMPACGASRYLAVTGEQFGQARYATDAAAAEAICRAAGATVVIAAHTSRWARVLPGVAQRLGGKVDTHVTSLTADLMASRWFYRQRMEGVLERSARPWIVLLDAGCGPAWEGAGGDVSVENITVETPRIRTVVTGKQAPKSEQQTIRPDAPLLFVAGAGWTKKQKDGQAHAPQAAALIQGFLHSSNASLGTSKSLTDMSGEGQAVLPFVSHLNQVGQTGSTPRHPKGLATCCHGEEPHVVGWRFIKERRAINLDANCGWARGKADVLYVADAFEVMEKVIARMVDETPRAQNRNS